MISPFEDENEYGSIAGRFLKPVPSAVTFEKRRLLKLDAPANAYSSIDSTVSLISIVFKYLA